MIHSQISMMGGIPHSRSDSAGSITMTSPSVNPIANWFGSCGLAAITAVYVPELLQKCKFITGNIRFCYAEEKNNWHFLVMIKPVQW